MDLILSDISDYDKTLLLYSINNYIEKLEFVLRNQIFYNTDEVIFNDLRNDLLKLEKLQKKICSVEI